MPSIVVVGSINRDIVARVPRHPVPGETMLTPKATLYPGGKGANQAVAAARLVQQRGSVRMVGRIGRDAYGHDMRIFLEAEAIDIAGVTETDSGTGFAFITVDDAGQNMITVVSGANMTWPRACPPLDLKARDVLVCQLEVPLPVVVSAFEQARAAKATTVLNAAPYQALPPKLLAFTDVLVVNQIELAQLAGRPLDAVDGNALTSVIREVMAKGPHAVVVTLGAAGALVVESSDRVDRIPGIGLHAIDTTGAGDCFVGAVAAALAESDDLASACRFANRAAAFSVTRAGAASSMPTRTDLAARS